MRFFLCLLMVVGVRIGSVEAQLTWLGGGAWGISPPVRASSGGIGLQAYPDHHWQVGVSRPIRGHALALGSLASFQFRSFFYELDKPLPYYPLKEHIPAFRLESVQLHPFLEYSQPIARSSHFGLGIRVGPVFSFHGGNHTTIATARAVPDGVPFQLYRLGVYRQPMGIPFFRSQLRGSYWVSVSRGWRWGFHPFVQLDLGDRSRIWYRVVPEDPLHRSEGWLRTGLGAVGLSCAVTRIR